MSWTCAQLESRLNGYLESKMAAVELREADQHARSCDRCREWFEAREARKLLLQLGELDSPPGFETRILARTLAPPERATLWQMFDEIWQALARPRVAYSLAAAAVTVAILFVGLDVPLSELQMADLNPVNIYRTVDRKANLAYASGVRYFNELRVVYEIRNQWAAFQTEDEAGNGDENESDDGKPTSRPGAEENQLQRGTDFLQSMATSYVTIVRMNP